MVVTTCWNIQKQMILEHYPPRLRFYGKVNGGHHPLETFKNNWYLNMTPQGALLLQGQWGSPLAENHQKQLISEHYPARLDPVAC